MASGPSPPLRKFEIKVPCSSANLGPGFDTIGVALSLHLSLVVTITPSSPNPPPYNCTISYNGDSPSSVSLSPSKNLTTRTALYVLRCFNTRTFPPGTHVAISNPIPLGRGLGSSAAAVIAGVLLANEVGNLSLSRARMLDFALMVERHPDNVAPALYGGLIVAGLRDLSSAEEQTAREAPHSEVPAGENTSAENSADAPTPPPQPPIGMAHCTPCAWSPHIKAVAVMPSFEVPTANARQVLPSSYSKADLVHNLQRIAALPLLLGAEEPDPQKIGWAMGDRAHQPYRMKLVPGLEEILEKITPEKYPGLCGICLSGAGPTILALVLDREDGAVGRVEEAIKQVFKERGIEAVCNVLEPAVGSAVEQLAL